LSASAGTGGIAIFGPGLIGGSVAMALRAKRPSLPLTVWGRNTSALGDLLKRGLADRVETDPAAAVRDADLVVLCTPVGTMERLAAALAPALSDNAVVTDAGSVKLPVVDRLTPILGSRFVGAHPIAGSERSGISAARANLFDSAPCIVTRAVRRLPVPWEGWRSSGPPSDAASPG